MDGKKSDGILQINSLYPADGFWWDSQLRIIPGRQAGDHFMEPYAHAVAEYDVCRLSRGGLFLDKGHTAQIQKFAWTYCQLPAKKFKTVGSSTDPVAIRELEDADNKYLYFINRDYYPVTILLCFDQKPVNMMEIGSLKIFNPRTEFELILGPYELRAFISSEHIHIQDFTITIPKNIEDHLRADSEDAIKIITQVEEKGFDIPGMKFIQDFIPKLLEEKKYAKLRRVLTSYIVRKARALLS